MKKPIFIGANAAIVTPFTNNNEVNYLEMKNIINFLISNNIDAITVCGTTGEVSTLSESEHKKIISYCAEVVNKRVPLIVGVGSNNTNYTLSLAKFAEKYNIDGLLIVTPYYNKTNNKGLIRHFLTIAENCNTPIILYNIPSRTGLSISPDTYFELSKHPNINGVKEASGNFSDILTTRALCQDNLNFWSGNDDQILPMLSLGSKGVISVIANIFPYQISQMIHNFLSGNIKKSLETQLYFSELINNLFIEVNPIPIKNLMKHIGFQVGNLRLPLYNMENNNFKKLLTSFEKIKI